MSLSLPKLSVTESWLCWLFPTHHWFVIWQRNPCCNEWFTGHFKTVWLILTNCYTSNQITINDRSISHIVSFIICSIHLKRGAVVKLYQHHFHIRWCWCRLTVTWWVSHVEQELLTLPEHMSSSPVFSRIRVARSLFFSKHFCRSLFVLFLLAIVLSVLWFTDSEYPLGVFICAYAYLQIKMYQLRL